MVLIWHFRVIKISNSEIITRFIKTKEDNIHKIIHRKNTNISMSNITDF